MRKLTRVELRERYIHEMEDRVKHLKWNYVGLMATFCAFMALSILEII